MRILSRSVLILALLAVAVIGLKTPARAQTGLTEEQLALIDRVIAARAIYEGYTSYILDVSETQTRDMTITIKDKTQSSSSDTSWNETATVIIGDKRNIQANAITTVDSSNTSQDGLVTTTNYTANIEFRLVDDVIYATAAYGPGTTTDNGPVLPNGWIVLDETSQSEWAVFDNIDLEDVRGTSPNLFDDEALIKENAIDVMLESTTLDDGTPIDLITIIFDRTGLQKIVAAMTEDNDPAMDALLQALDDTSGATLAIALDAENNALAVYTLQTLNATGVSAETFGIQRAPLGTTVDLASTSERTETYSQVNVAFVPATAPEVTTP
jgi:hypothetical protein